MKLVVSPPRRTSALLLLAAGIAVGASLLTRGSGPPLTAVTPSVAEPANPALSARATSSYLLRGVTETHIAITVRAPELARAARPPVSLAVVIDRSGSMSGLPLEHAKAAAQRLVEQLAGSDRFAVITYSTGAETIAPARYATAAAKASAIDAIAAIAADGGTNVSQGLIEGARAIADGSDGLRRIVLISDGQANEGISREGLPDLAAATATAGTAITSVGVGLDFDEVTMSAIAVAGRGHYYFVEDTSQLAALFLRELDSLGDTVASDAELAVVPAAGVEVLEAYGYRTVREVNGAVRVPVADLVSAEVRKVVLRVRVAAHAVGARPLASVHLAWTPRGALREEVAQTTVRATVTEDAVAVSANRDRDVVRQVQDIETARALEQAASAYERGDQAQAAGILEEREAQAAAVSADLRDPTLSNKTREMTRKAKGAFAAPPGQGDGSKRALKASRADAYHLRY